MRERANCFTGPSCSSLQPETGLYMPVQSPRGAVYPPPLLLNALTPEFTE